MRDTPKDGYKGLGLGKLKIYQEVLVVRLGGTGVMEGGGLGLGMG